MKTKYNAAMGMKTTPNKMLLTEFPLSYATEMDMRFLEYLVITLQLSGTDFGFIEGVLLSLNDVRGVDHSC